MQFACTHKRGNSVALKKILGFLWFCHLRTVRLVAFGGRGRYRMLLKEEGTRYTELYWLNLRLYFSAISSTLQSQQCQTHPCGNISPTDFTERCKARGQSANCLCLLFLVQQLKGKILVKGKKLSRQEDPTGTNGNNNLEAEDVSDEDEAAEMEDESVKTEVQQKGKVSKRSSRFPKRVRPGEAGKL